MYASVCLPVGLSVCLSVGWSVDRSVCRSVGRSGAHRVIGFVCWLYLHILFSWKIDIDNPCFRAFLNHITYDMQDRIIPCYNSWQHVTYLRMPCFKHCIYTRPIFLSLIVPLLVLYYNKGQFQLPTSVMDFCISVKGLVYWCHVVVLFCLWNEL